MFRRDKWWMHELARREQEWAQERKELLDRIMLLAGQPWSPPPVMDFTHEVAPEDFGLEDENVLREAELAL